MNLPNSNEPDPIELWVLLLLSGGQKMTVHDLVRILARTLDVIWQALQRLKNWKYVKDEKGKYFITIEGIEYLALKGISATEPDDDPAPKDFIKKIRPPFFSSWSELALWAATPLIIIIIALSSIVSITWGYNYVAPIKIFDQIMIAVVSTGIIVLYIRASHHNVMENEKLVVFRSGKAIAQKGTGHAFLLPLVDNPKKVDLREKSKEISKEPCITKDKLLIQAGFYISWQIDDPISSLTKVSNVEDSMHLFSTAILRTSISEYNLEDAMKMRKALNNLIRTRLEQKTGDWGVKINNTEIRELHPPEDVMRSIENLFKATLESEAALTKSETQAESLRKLFEIGSQIDNRTFLLRYLETLEKVGNGTSAKYLIPFEFFQKLEAWIEAEDHLAEKPKANNTPNNNLLNPSQRLKNG